MVVLYGSAVADTTLTTACLMATASGGVETSKVTTYSSGSGNFGEVWSKGNASAAAVSALPAPTGHGWIYYPGAGTFAAGNWTLVITAAYAVNDNDPQTFRAYKLSGGIYTAIGTITFNDSTAAKTTYSPAAVSMSTVTFAAGDGLYFDLWYQDSFGAVTDTATIYESTSSTAGVASDLQVTTSTFTAGGVTNNSMASTDALVVSDLGPALFRWPVDGLSAVERALYAATDLPVDALTAVDVLLGTDTDHPVDASTVSDIQSALFRWPVDALSASDSLLGADGALPVESLPVADLVLGTDGSLSTEANSVTGSLLRTDGSLFTESNSATDSLLGQGSGLLVDSLATSDAVLGTDTDLSSDGLTASDLGGNLARWPVDALTATDGLTGIENAVLLEGLSGAEVDLAVDLYSRVESLSADDSASTMVSSPAGGVTTTTYSFTEALVASSSFLCVDGASALEGNQGSSSMGSAQGSAYTESLSASDSLLKLDGYVPFDALTLSDMGSVGRWPVDGLVASDSLLAADSYLPADVQSVLESLQATDGAGWVDLLAVSDTSSMVSAAATALLYLTATCTTRDMQATAKTRDMQATATTRDEQATGRARDMQATASARDERATAKTRG